MIAVLLLLHLIKPVVLPPSVQAQGTQDVRIVSIASSAEYGLWALPVEVRGAVRTH